MAQKCTNNDTITINPSPSSLHIRVNKIQGRDNQAETPGKWGKKRWRIFP